MTLCVIEESVLNGCKGQSSSLSSFVLTSSTLKSLLIFPTKGQM